MIIQYLARSIKLGHNQFPTDCYDQFCASQTNRDIQMKGTVKANSLLLDLSCHSIRNILVT